MTHDDFIKLIDRRFTSMSDSFNKTFNNLMVKEKFDISGEDDENSTWSDFNKSDSTRSDFNKFFDDIVDKDFNKASSDNSEKIDFKETQSFERLPTAARKEAFCDSLRTDLPSRRTCIL